MGTLTQEEMLAITEAMRALTRAKRHDQIEFEVHISDDHMLTVKFQQPIVRLDIDHDTAIELAHAILDVVNKRQ